MKEYYKKTGEDLHKNVPLTFLIQEEDKDESFEEFKTYYKNNLSGNSSNQWILKPGEFTNRGKGIQVCKKYSSIEKYVKSSKRNCCIIQKYINNPLLLNTGSGGGRKFDIRCFGLYTCFNNEHKGYFFQEGYLRTSCKEFNEKNK